MTIVDEDGNPVLTQIEEQWLANQQRLADLENMVTSNAEGGPGSPREGDFCGNPRKRKLH